MSAALLQRLPRAVRPLDDPPNPSAEPDPDLRDVLPSAIHAAAVLVPVVRRPAGPSLLFTRRTDHLTRHAGQVSFPGGRAEPHDADAIATALRETNEEVGIDSRLLLPFGYLDCLDTISGYSVTPVVAWLDANYRAQPDPHEVAEVFEAPLEFFLAPEHLRRMRVDYRGKPREVLEFAWPGPRIWGATAAMLLNLVRRLEATP